MNAKQRRMTAYNAKKAKEAALAASRARANENLRKLLDKRVKGAR